MSPTGWINISWAALDPQPALPFPLCIALEGESVIFRDQGQALTPEDLLVLEEAELRIAREDCPLYLQMQLRAFDRSMGNSNDPQEGLKDHLRRVVAVLPIALEALPAPDAFTCIQGAVTSSIAHLECCGWHFESVLPAFPIDASLVGHSARTMTLGVMLGKQLGIADVEELALGLLLLDWGLLDLVGPIDLSKEDPSLHPKYREHPQRGEQLCRRVRGVTLRVRDVVKNHHERLDGSGFPRRISGDHLSDPTRIAAIVDRIERWRASAALPPSAESYTELLSTLRTEESDRFDANLIDLFLTRLRAPAHES